MQTLAVQQLPETGVEIASWAIAAVAVLAVIAGVVAMIVSRRRAARRDDAEDA